MKGYQAFIAFSCISWLKQFFSRSGAEALRGKINKDNVEFLILNSDFFTRQRNAFSVPANHRDEASAAVCVGLSGRSLGEDRSAVNHSLLLHPPRHCVSAGDHLLRVAHPPYPNLIWPIQGKRHGAPAGHPTLRCKWRRVPLP